MKPRKPIGRRTPLKRSQKPLKRTRLKKVSSKRSREMKVYSEKRKQFLASHKFCQLTIKSLGLNEDDVIAEGGFYKDVWGRTVRCPAATEVHHGAGRTGGNYLDETTWFAASADMHRKVHLEPSWARANGFLR